MNAIVRTMLLIALSISVITTIGKDNCFIKLNKSSFVFEQTNDKEGEVKPIFIKNLKRDFINITHVFFCDQETDEEEYMTSVSIGQESFNCKIKQVDNGVESSNNDFLEIAKEVRTIHINDYFCEQEYRSYYWPSQKKR